MKNLITALTLSAALVYPFASEASFKFKKEKPTLSITEIVVQSGGEFDRNQRDFDILLNAVLAAGLEGALADANADLTTFAPNDRAFIRLARDLGFEGRGFHGQLEADAFEFIVTALTELGNGDPIPLLTNILLYHVSPGSKTFDDIFELESIDTLFDGETIHPRRNILIDNEPELKDPRLLASGRDIQASNGIIQTIDRVLIPIDLPNSPDDLGTITDIVSASGGVFDANPFDFDILLNAVSAAGLASALDDADAHLTVFAPDDLAFMRLARDLGYRGFDEAEAFDVIVDALTTLGEGDPIPLLTNVLLYHVAPEKLTLKKVLGLEDVETLLNGATFSPDGRVLVDNDPGLRNPRLKVGKADVRAANGIIHPISRVLIPISISGH